MLSRRLLFALTVLALAGVVGASVVVTRAPGQDRADLLPVRVRDLIRNGTPPAHPTTDAVPERAAHPLAGGLDVFDIIFRDVQEIDPCDGVECPTGELCENGTCTSVCDLLQLPDGLFIPQLSPQASGPFVNFESPAIRPLAMTSDGRGVYATNTPNNSLVLLTTINGLRRVGEVPVGLEPVAVAIQPGTNNAIAWVANMISDNVSIVNVPQRRVVTTVDVGDEPVNILFDAAGSYAFVIVQGRGSPANFDSTTAEQGFVVVVDTATHQVVGETFLGLDTPRAAVYDPQSQELIVAALHSGNRTTSVGALVVLQKADPPPATPTMCEQDCQCDCVTSNVLEVVRDFSLTAGILSGSAVLGPEYPDPHDDPAFPLASPKVHRIVPDEGGAWQAIVDVLVDSNGVVVPGVAEQLRDELNLISAAHAEDVIAVIHENLQQTTVDRDLIVLDVSAPTVAPLPTIETVAGLGTSLTGLGRDAASGRLYLSNLEPLNLTRHEPVLQGGFLLNQLLVLAADRTLQATVDLAPPAGGTAEGLQAAREASLANPLDTVIDSEAGVGYVVAFGPGRIGTLDLATHQVLGRVDVGRGPRSAVLHPGGQRLFVLTRTDLAVVEIDVSDPAAPVVVETVGLFNPEPADVHTGRHFLYGTEFSLNNDLSCASCHIDGDKDGTLWDLGNPGGPVEGGPPNLGDPSNHPLKGPMVTQSLKGLATHEPFHWRGDRGVFQDFNPAFEGLLGGSELSDADMDAYAAFIATVVFPPSPFYNRDGSFLEGALAIRGACQFINRCDGCHQLLNDGAFEDPSGGGDGGNNLNGLNLQKSLVTQLRDVHSKFPGKELIHDAREGRFFEGQDVGHPLETFLRTFFGFTQAQRDELIAFVTAFQSNVSPATGWQVVARGQGNRAEVESALDTMVFHVDLGGDPLLPTQNDVVAKHHGVAGTTGFWLTGTTPQMFQSDLGDIIDRATLLDGVGPDDTLVVMAVPVGSGRRIGIDQDLDCVGDGLDPTPQRNDQHDANFDGLVDNRDFNGLVACLALDGPIPPGCTIFDSDCGGVLDQADIDDFLATVAGPAADCNGNGIDDLQDILSGASVDEDHNAIPDECPGVVVAASGGRYLQVAVDAAGAVALAVGGPNGCFSQYVDPMGLLTDTAVFREASEWGVVQIRGRRIVPGTPYTVRLDTGTPGAPVLSAAVAATTWTWGDTTGEGVVDLTDIFTAIAAYAGDFSTATLEGTDLRGAVPDRLTTIDDIIATIDAFSGRSYSGSAACE